ncbi:hypothetical protein [Actinomadura sp. 7K507]|uniref:hypothetical protein n=1 Tax=Actinomadura sp. 7K507 TaxID=2530365 RepID=UPI0010467028|nr:hypothetical protein [Actinomadura sp. 7K507]TDC96153.1 hypothetical protein E1285_06105 [Actinomadura sp. 7K507]
MSTRILALLTTAAAALALAGGITAANASPAAPPPEPSAGAPAPAPAAPAPAAPAPDASPSASPSSTESPEKEDAGKEDAALEDCRDADCEIEIKDGQEIKLDDGLGAESIKVEVKGTRVTFTVRNKHSRAVTSMEAQGPGTTANFNGLTLRPHRGEDGKLMLELSHV